MVPVGEPCDTVTFSGPQVGTGAKCHSVTQVTDSYPPTTLGEAAHAPAPIAPVCPSCGAELSAEDVEKCRKTLPGWEDAPHPAGVVAAAEGGSPNPTALDRAMAKIRSELGSLVA